MNFFDYYIMLLPVLLALLKQLTDANRDENRDSPWRTFFRKFGMEKAWLNEGGGHDGTADVWHIADQAKFVLLYLAIIFFPLSEFGKWMLALPTVLFIFWSIIFIALSLYMFYAFFTLFYHHLLTSRRSKFTQWLKFLANPFRNLHKGYDD